MTNIAKFYQTETHDYENFFKNYESSSKEKELNSLIKGLNEQLENAKVELSRVQNESYNKDFTPNGKTIIVHYASNRSDLSLYFDLLSGNAVDINDYNMKEVLLKEVNLKGGEFWVNVGYCFPLGAAVSRNYKYRIASNNLSCSFILVDEGLFPVLDKNASPVSKSGEPCQFSWRDSATSFIAQLYDIPQEQIGVHYNFTEFKFTLERNASTEIILRTAPKEIQRSLLNRKITEAIPVYKILNLTKAEYKKVVDLGVATQWLDLQDFIKTATDEYGYGNPDSGCTAESYFHYTVDEWIGIIQKSKYWDEELLFNHVQNENEGSFGKCLRWYLGVGYGRRGSHIYEYYTFGKFMDYVCEEAINQGFKSLHAFIQELNDYINMCITMDLKPTLYSSYLKQTHDIAARNYEIKLTEEQEELFENAYKNFKPFVTEDKTYSIVRPKNADDVKYEGSALNHCVYSYLSKIIKRNCLIVFLRKTKNTDKPLVTIEIENEAIVQARGASNRSITEDEYKAICEYAKKNKLKVRVSPRD